MSAFAGLINGFFGSGGGTAAVLLMKKAGFEGKAAHAASLLFILPLSAVSLVVYLIKNGFSLAYETLLVAAGGCVGAIAGSGIMKRIKAPVLEKVFGAAMCIAGIWTVMR